MILIYSSMGHSLNQSSLNIDSNFIFNNNNTQDDYILVSGTYGEATWDLKSNYISSEFDHYIGELYGGGVVTAVWKENEIEVCLVVAPQDIRYQYYYFDFDIFYYIGDVTTWSNVIGTYSGASYSSIGASNSVIITTQPGFNPSLASPNRGAAQHCLGYINSDLGTNTYIDWYLPSIYELKTLSDNLAIVNKVLYQYSIDTGRVTFDAIDETSGAYTLAPIHLIDNRTSDVGYWSSSEKSATSSYYMALNTGGLKMSVASKSSAKRIRPFRIARPGDLGGGLYE